MALIAFDRIALAGSPMFRVWRHAGFARFMMGIAPYYITTWMQRVAVGWMAWELSHSHAWVGAIAAADLGPMVVLSPLAGALADRFDAMRQMRLAQAAMVAQAILLAAAALSGLIDIWLLLVLSLVSGIIQPVYTAARQAVIPGLVERADFATAVSVDAAMFHGSRFIGPALAAISIPLIGPGGTCAAHVLGCLAFSLMVARIHFTPPERSATERASLMADVVEGFDYVRRHDVLRPMFLLLLVASVVARPMQDLLPGFAGGVFEAGPMGLAWLTSSMGVGSLSAAILLATRGRVDGLVAWTIVATCGLALATFGFVATRHISLALAFGVLFGAALTSMGIGVQAIAQVAVTDGLRGRVLSVYSLIYRGMPAVGAVLIGFLAEWIGLRSAFAISALLCLLAWLAIAPRHAEIEQAVRRE